LHDATSVKKKGNRMSAQNNITDSTKLNDLKRCPRFYFLRHILGWSPTSTGFDLIVGQAWHEAMATLLRYKQDGKTYADGQEAALLEFSRVYSQIEEPPTTGAKTEENCMTAICMYVDYYKNDDFGVVAIECPGVVPITETRCLHFRLDAILLKKDAAGDMLYVVDHKTTIRSTSTSQLRWFISTQMGAYLHFLYLYLSPYEPPKRTQVVINEALLAVPQS